MIPQDMKIPKYKLGQIVYYMANNRVHGSTITSVNVVENMHNDWNSNKEQKQTWQPFGPSGIFYATCHGVLEEEKVFASQEELTASL